MIAAIIILSSLCLTLAILLAVVIFKYTRAKRTLELVIQSLLLSSKKTEGGTNKNYAHPNVVSFPSEEGF